MIRRAAVVVLVAGGLALATAGTAAAHPLGNFTVNHHAGLVLHPDRIEIRAVLDLAEIPTFQERAAVDTDGDGTVGPAEGSAHAATICADRQAAATLAVDGAPVAMGVIAAEIEFPVGEQGLPTTRVTCRLEASADLAGRSTVAFTDGYLTDRVGWREITATGAGVRIVASDVPEQSSSQELRAYPQDLLADPLDQRTATLDVEPGSGSAAPLQALPPTGVGWLDGLLASGERALSGLVGRVELTPAVAGLAVLMSLVLGAAHAVLPGHGKTVMAAYLAGRDGTRRDAFVVGATVTVTHTAGVLAFGLLITLVAQFAPVTAIRWLGVLSGVLVAGVGAALLRTAVRRRQEIAALPVAERVGVLVAAVPGGSAGHGHGHGHGGHGHGHGHGHGGPGRAGLVGMGVAGGLVPSPTALLVLLAAVQFGRTWFGIGLVLCYALGMAGTLTAAGLLLVGLRDRLTRIDRPWLRGAVPGAAILPIATAALVLVVGLGLALRALAV